MAGIGGFAVASAIEGCTVIPGVPADTIVVRFQVCLASAAVNGVISIPCAASILTTDLIPALIRQRMSDAVVALALANGVTLSGSDILLPDYARG